MSKPESFYIVWSPQGSMPPRVRHSDYSGALKAAEDMSRLHGSQEFYVMRACSVSKIVSVITTQLDDEDRIPF